jgi:hypothetical protein
MPRVTPMGYRRKRSRGFATGQAKGENGNAPFVRRRRAQCEAAAAASSLPREGSGAGYLKCAVVLSARRASASASGEWASDDARLFHGMRRPVKRTLPTCGRRSWGRSESDPLH